MARRRGNRMGGDLGRFYSEAEKVLAVTPLDLETLGRNGQLCAEGAGALGASGGPISRNAGKCIQCSSCPLGCQIDAKRASHVSYLRAPSPPVHGPRRSPGAAHPHRERPRDRARLQGGNADERRPGGQAQWPPASPAATGRPGQGGDQRRAAPSHPNAASLRASITPPSVGTSTSIPPPGSARATRRRCAAGTGVMQSYYVDQWQPEGILLEATFTPLSFGAQWLPGVGAAFSDRVAHFGNIASIGVHLHDRSEGRVGSRRTDPCGSPTGCSRRRRNHPVRDRARSRDALRRGRDRGLSQRRAGLGDPARAGSPSSSR